MIIIIILYVVFAIFIYVSLFNEDSGTNLSSLTSKTVVIYAGKKVVSSVLVINNCISKE